MKHQSSGLTSQQASQQFAHTIRNFPKRQRIQNGLGFWFFIKRGGTCVLPASGYATVSDLHEASEDVLRVLRRNVEILNTKIA